MTTEPRERKPLGREVTDQAEGAPPAVNALEDLPLVKLEGVLKRFGSTTALRGVSLSVDRGSVLGLLGPNGSGKSTLLKTLVGLYHPEEGRVLIGGVPPSGATRAITAYVPEEDHLYDWMSVGGMLDFVSRFYDDWDAVKARELLDFMGLDRSARVGSLSKGMRGRLRLILAMARAADLVLLDEPLAGLDLPSRARILETIIGEYRAGDQTIILSTHEVAEVETVFDRVVLLQEGRVVLDEEAEDLRRKRGKSVEALMKEVFA